MGGGLEGVRLMRPLGAGEYCSDFSKSHCEITIFKEIYLFLLILNENLALVRKYFSIYSIFSQDVGLQY